MFFTHLALFNTAVNRAESCLVQESVSCIYSIYKPLPFVFQVRDIDADFRPGHAVKPSMVARSPHYRQGWCVCKGVVGNNLCPCGLRSWPKVPIHVS